MNILGLSSLEPSPFGHDSTTAIFDEDNFFVISEERLTRIKHDGGYPSSSIQLCLNENNSTISDIDSVVVGFGLEKKYMGILVNIFQMYWLMRLPQTTQIEMVAILELLS